MEQVKYKPLKVKPDVHKKVKLTAVKEGKTINDVIDERFEED